MYYTIIQTSLNPSAPRTTRGGARGRQHCWEPRPSHPKRITTTAQGTWTVCLVLHASAHTGRRSRSRPRALERERERSRTDASTRERVQTLASRSCRLQCTRATVHAAPTAARRDASSAHRVGTRRRGNGWFGAQQQAAVHPRDGARSPDCSSSGRAQRAQGGDAPTRERVRGAAVHPRGGARSPDCSSPGRAQRARVGDAGTGAGADGAGARAPGVSGRVSSVSVRPV